MYSQLSDESGKLLSKHISDLENKFEQLTFSRTPVNNNAAKKVVNNLGDLLTNSTFANNLNIDDDLNAVYNYYNKYYSTLKDYETMPSMIPQLVRVLNFLINEVISPDSQGDNSFVIKCDDDKLSDEIAHIRNEHMIDRELRDVVQKRFRLGKVFYLVQGYQTLFNIVSNLQGSGNINETTSISNIGAKLDEYCTIKKLSGGVDLLLETTSTNEATGKTVTKKEEVSIKLEDLNITVEYGAIAEDYKAYMKTISSVLNEASNFSAAKLTGKGFTDPVTVGEYLLTESLINVHGVEGIEEAFASNSINENYHNFGTMGQINAGYNKDKIIKIAKTLSKNDSVRRASVTALDPARVFPLKASNRIIGYFYYEEQPDVNVKSFNDLLVKSLKNSKIGKDAYKETEEAVTRKTAEYLINNIKDNLNIENINDIDLLHDYITNSKVADGNMKFKFYYKDDVIDISRTDGSLLINSVYQAKLLAFLMHNNIVTKITKGRDREIFTVNMGASASVTPYLNAAMDSLASANDGIYRALSGPLSKILNPQMNSTIIIPTQDGADKFIQADIIQGQDVDMDMDIIKFLQNNIITSYGIDPGMIDLINNNVDFAKSLSMMNKEMLILNINEQLDIIQGWSKFVLAILYEEGSDKLREAIDAKKIEVELYKPKSLLLEVAQNEVNSAKSFAEAVVELSPMIASITNDEENELTRRIAVYEIVRGYISDDFSKYDKIFDKAATEKYVDMQTKLEAIRASRKVTREDVDADIEEDFS